MDKKRLVLPGTLVVAAAVVAAVSLWPDPKDDMREQNLCWGSLTEKTAGLLNDGKAGKTSDDVMGGSSGKAVKDDQVFGTVCTVTRENPGGETYREQYALTATTSDGTSDAPKGAKPLGGGHEGWLTLRHSVLRLPEDCVSKMGSTNRYGELLLSVYPQVNIHENWNTGSVTTKSRTILLESAANLAKQYDCAA